MFARIRKDLILKGVGVPIGNDYYFNSEYLKYRWLSEFNFQVFHQNVWKDAESIDWNFY